ncbi:protein FAM32A [Anolis carolinensis]|uniref:protein FAM32A n=1 Tax=Anolis carolinensis TaxID=28377 RepID=UPI002F2B8113
MSEYEAVQRGPLRLKAGSGAAATAAEKQRKKRKRKKAEGAGEEEDGSARVEKGVSSKTPDDKEEEGEEEEEEEKRALDKRTPAQLAYEKIQEKRQIERILKKASKTHKQRVEDFNRHLDTLTEHYDIPKVSWTK